MLAAGPNKREDDADEDEDDWGIPARGSKRGLGFGLHFRRYRLPFLIAACIVAFVYWLQHRSTVEVPAPTDWSRFAYVHYVTDIHSTCNAFMVFEALNRLGSTADRVLLYPDSWQSGSSSDDPNDRTSQLLALAEKLYKVHLQPTQILGLDGAVDPEKGQHDTSITKLRVFELEQYDRLLYLDTDILLKQHLDELFLLPATPIAMPRSYWLDWTPRDWPLSSTLMLIEPNAAETATLWQRLQAWRLDPDRPTSPTYLEDLLNERFASSALILPHRRYVLTSSEFRRHDHEAYLGTSHAPATTPKWEPHAALQEAKLVRFDDWPLPKPWIMWPRDGLTEMQPDCGDRARLGTTCGDREVWKNLYEEFRLRRKDVCKMLSVPAPQNWEDYKNRTSD